MSRLAAIVFDRDEAPDAPLIDFIDAVTRRGVRVAGLVQERAGGDLRDLHDVQVRDLVSGDRLPIMQDLGPEASGCRVDPAATALAARFLDRALEGRPDLLVVNRFGRLESEGGGMLGEIGRAFADGVALIVCVPKRYREAWNAFADGLDAQLPPSSSAIHDWWEALARAGSERSAADA